MNRAAYGLLWLHVAALALGLFGILYAIPHAEVWTRPPDMEFFAWAMPRAGWLGMVSGAIVMFAWGFETVGWRRTLVFAAFAIAVSAAAELTGTKTGWPFGGYEYLTLLGWKLAGRVPFGVPLAWFYMGFAAYVLASAIVSDVGRHRTWAVVLLAAWLLTAWDLVLDPAMAALPQIKFWHWHEQGPYYGMPLRNLVGWYATGLTFIGLAALVWGRPLKLRVSETFIPFVVYVANIVWAIALALSAGIWPPAVAAIIVSILPAAYALRGRRKVALDVT